MARAARRSLAARICLFFEQSNFGQGNLIVPRDDALPGRAVLA
jgi:hypothetical protein